MAALTQVWEAAGPYLEQLPERLVYDRAAEPLLGELGGPLPEGGSGTGAAIERLLRIGTATATASAGPRFFHFVIGGSTPAALAADWVVSLLDQNAFVGPRPGWPTRRRRSLWIGCASSPACRPAGVAR